MIEVQDEVSPDVGGGTLAWLANAPEAARNTGSYFFGSYFFDCPQPLDLITEAADDATAARLWDESEKVLARSEY